MCVICSASVIWLKYCAAFEAILCFLRNDSHMEELQRILCIAVFAISGKFFIVYSSCRCVSETFDIITFYIYQEVVVSPVVLEPILEGRCVISCYLAFRHGRHS